METVTVDDIMVPRNEIAGIDIDDDWKAIMRQLNHAPHNRIVLYKGSLDEQVLGILRVREAFSFVIRKKMNLPKKPYYVPSMKCTSFQKGHH